MKRKIGILAAAGLLLILWSECPLSAESRSATVRVSCTINPMMQISMNRSSTTTSQDLSSLDMTGFSSGVSVTANLEKNFKVSESTRSTPDALLKVFSVTAL